ncbi:NADH:flavin oxidoreductase/NADH oxidase [Microdochium trichocladiopsis]|uniref:NADH:flavin oxidoreductase/NADH oxidase n=1 Tax=Microdochium trichocladiopsis TaxID=1682393 RepID=A0A9P9BV10_9PEZI|nr:NADH:flavin oxidoreductase/NADH oxidase [Microdochium trichocladiopsis]KAH7039823.1 NADH:flavin oxidoreductase/NADH oxidase [Microdochium trichocladiopsis]
MPSATLHGPFEPLNQRLLFSPLKIGAFQLKHRIVQGPCTRMRSDLESRGVYVPGVRVAKYYSDRASAGGLQITEATDICLDASAYPGVPGVFTPSQLRGWRQVTDAVHAKGGVIVSQLWHTGRASGTAMRGGNKTVSSGELPMSGNYLDGTPCESDPPRPLTVDGIHDLTAEWAAAAKRAVEEAGFDGVEIHAANGYLLEQFLHDNINQRSDAYGGSIENRCRFPLEVIQAVTEAIGADRVGIRLSPYNYYQDTRDSDPSTHWAFLCEKIAGLPARNRPAYVHMVEPRVDDSLSEEQKLASLGATTKTIGLTPFRNILKAAGISFLAAGNFSRENAVAKLEEGARGTGTSNSGDGSDGEVVGAADAIVFGRHFIANPDLVARLGNGWPLNKYDRTTFYGASPPEKGYNDYPLFSEAS